MKREFCYLSKDKETQIHAVEWVPDGEVKAVLQLCHGMVEYIERYDEFARYLAERGWYVVGNDHLGHGKSVQTEEHYGFFHVEHGNQFVVGDIHKLREMTAGKYPDKPYFILGHSMGSFLTRQYIKTYGKGLAGVIIMATGYQPGWLLSAGQMFCKAIAGKKGWNYRSKLVDNMAFGSYNKSFEPSKTHKDWVTSDPEKLTEYVRDPLCSFTFTVNAYYHMFSGMKELTKKENLERIPKTLPILFAAGKDDPVGDFGKGVKKVYDKYKACGIQDVEMKLYEGDRHEILNETDRQQVYEDLYCWLEERR